MWYFGDRVISQYPNITELIYDCIEVIHQGYMEQERDYEAEIGRIARHIAGSVRLRELDLMMGDRCFDSCNYDDDDQY